jgi:CheY-like chemotaxis protein
MPLRTLPLAVLGLSEAERHQLALALRPPGDGRLSFRLEADPQRAALIVADVDDPEVVRAIRCGGLLGRTVAVGDRRCTRVAYQLTRPLDPAAVLAALARLAAGALADAAGDAAGDPDCPASPEARRVLEALAGYAIRAAPAVEEVLVVDADEPRLRHMAGLLGRLGFEAHLARSAPVALARVMDAPLAFVFVAPELEGMDGFQLCRAIRRLPDELGHGTPTLVLLARAGTPSDRVRASAVGCEHVLQTPVHSVDLQRVVGAREVHRLPFVRTAQSDPAF